MKSYRIRFTPEAAQGISRLHPEHKKIIRSALDRLRSDPFSGDDLQGELSEFKSVKPRRFRIIYRVDENHGLVQVLYVGHRRDVYEQFRRFLIKLKP